MITIKEFVIGHKNPNGYGTMLSGPNSAGGIDVKVSFKNDSPKTIKYITFHVVPYNAVNDSVEEVLDVKITGPIKSGKNGDYICENCWYNITIKYAKITYVDIIYMDETTEIIYPNQLNIVNSLNNAGCYVATCVYGSYDCPQVWTLRRYRDKTLASTWYGRAFIYKYYAIAPIVVKFFGKTKWFNRFFRKRLDKMVARLKREGFEDTPYNDRNW